MKEVAFKSEMQIIATPESCGLTSFREHLVLVGLRHLYLDAEMVDAELLAHQAVSLLEHLLLMELVSVT